MRRRGGEGEYLTVTDGQEPPGRRGRKRWIVMALTTVILLLVGTYFPSTQYGRKLILIQEPFLAKNRTESGESSQLVTLPPGKDR